MGARRATPAAGGARVGDADPEPADSVTGRQPAARVGSPLRTGNLCDGFKSFAAESFIDERRKAAPSSSVCDC